MFTRVWRLYSETQRLSLTVSPKQPTEAFNSNSQVMISLRLSTTPENVCRNGAQTPRVLNTDTRNSFTTQRYFVWGKTCFYPLIRAEANIRTGMQRLKKREFLVRTRNRTPVTDCSRLLDCAV
jgi:hypothetical protein